MHRDTITIFVLILVLLLVWSPATAKIVVEPISPEICTDVAFIDDEEIVPIWHLTPEKIVMCFALIYCPLLACPIELFYSIGIWTYLGYRRVSRHRPFDNQNRWQIFSCIGKNPGISATEIATAIGVSRGTVHYHLTHLQDRSLIHKIVKGKAVGYFAYTDRLDTDEEQILLHFKNTTKKNLLSVLRKTPGISQSEVAEAVEVSRPTVSWHMERLINDGLVEAKKAKGRVRYRLTHDALELLDKERGGGGKEEEKMDPRSATA
ncbi:putative transcriptional regulator [Methanofollis sp. W23]|uniref:winged helix-turn-helix transcriptional regulator n=1 Tax=Methanofollis sp. W23 TaxID=2817849 RepID=UPI001AE20EF2|nr:winged helix-turn-helix transcriptional regulator [Methanofollis sp. W23]MBP2145923.1 putative transcriptional regulator [Methanofollis sp. W23]